MKSALLLVDIQNDYFPGGKCELFQPEQAAENARRLLNLFRGRKLPVFHVQHISNRPQARCFLPGTDGAEIHALVRPQDGETVVVKHFPNSFLHTGLEQNLRAEQVEQVVVSGMMSHMCVVSTVRAARDLDFSVLLADDACATRSLRWDDMEIPAQTVHRAMMASLNGMFAQVQKTQTLLETADNWAD